jgi:hypothetical protein
MRLYLRSLLFAALLLAASAGCYPRGGQPVEMTPQQLLERAVDACERRDPAAWSMLVNRLTEHYPDSPQGRRARQRFAPPSTTFARCHHWEEDSAADGSIALPHSYNKSSDVFDSENP